MALSKIDVANMLTGATPVANGGTAATTLAGAGLAKRPNASPILLNGDMAVAQRGTSTTSITSAGYYTCDRFKLNRDGIGTWTVIQESLTSGEAYNNGFRKAFRMDCTSATASPSADNNLSVIVRVEGQDLQLFKKGTSNAEKFTLAFWVKSNKTGTSQVNLRDNDNTRLISATYAISSANTWEHKVLNFAADTTGAFDNDNALSLQIEWFLDSGTDFSSGTAPTAWEAANNTDRNANNLALGNSTDNDWAITGVQLEVGEYTSSTLPPFQHESYGDNLKRCERYCLQLEHDMTGGNETQVAIGWAYNTSSAYGFRDFAVQMRTQPTMSSADGDGTNYYRIHTNNAASLFEQLAFTSSSKRGYWIAKTGLSSLTANQIHTIEMVNSNAYVRADAEL